jgi:hypothetical protein
MTTPNTINTIGNGNLVGIDDIDPCTPEELRAHVETCGVRVLRPFHSDRIGTAKGLPKAKLVDAVVLFLMGLGCCDMSTETTTYPNCEGCGEPTNVCTCDFPELGADAKITCKECGGPIEIVDTGAGQQGWCLHCEGPFPKPIGGNVEGAAFHAIDCPCHACDPTSDLVPEHAMALLAECAVAGYDVNAPDFPNVRWLSDKGLVRVVSDGDNPTTVTAYLTEKGAKRQQLPTMSDLPTEIAERIAADKEAADAEKKARKEGNGKVKKQSKPRERAAGWPTTYGTDIEELRNLHLAIVGRPANGKWAPPMIQRIKKVIAGELATGAQTKAPKNGKKIQVVIDAELARYLDEECGRRGTTRVAVVTEALQDLLKVDYIDDADRQ